MSYIDDNKKAWEQAFMHRSGAYAKDLTKRLELNDVSFFHKDFLEELNAYPFENKNVAQFCCNNGRELLELSKRNINQGIGFDIAKNMVENANDIATNLTLPAKFIETNILKLESKYNGFFDYGLITVGVLCWFKDLNEFFKKVSQSLKTNGRLFIHESHPFGNMLATKEEPKYDASNHKLLVYDYFGNTVWKDQEMGYMSGSLKTESVFTSYAHTLSDIFAAMHKNHLTLTVFKEHGYCVGNIFNHLDHQGLPLSMIMVAKKG